MTAEQIWIERHIYMKDNFTIKKTSERTVLISEMEKTEFELTQRKVDLKFFSLCNKVKSEGLKYVRKNPIHIKYKPKYFGFNELFLKEETEFLGYSIDVRACYWEIAKRLFLSETTYLKGILDKENRLKVLGCLARKKEIFTYEKGILVNKEINYPETRNLFFYICHLADDLITRIFWEKRNVIGYWVDCVFTNDVEILPIVEYFSKNEFKVKLEKIQFNVVKKFNILYLKAESEKEIKMYPIVQNKL